MKLKKRIFWLITLLTAISLIIVFATLSILYTTAFEQQRLHLIDSVKSQASLIRNITKYNLFKSPNLIDKTTKNDHLDTIIITLFNPFKKNEQYGFTENIYIAKLQEDKVVFLVNFDMSDSVEISPDNNSSPSVEAMSRAFSGESGSLIYNGFKGKQFLAAYEPIKELGVGIISEIELSKIQQPFIHAGLISVLIALVLSIFGAFLLLHIGNPLIRELLSKQNQLRNITSTIPGCLYQFTLGKDGCMSFPYLSTSIQSLFGIDSEILTEDATKMYDYIHPDDQDKFNDSVQISANSMDVWECEYRIITPTDKIIWVHGKAYPSIQSEGSILWNGILTDITNLKETELRYQNSNTLLCAIIDAAPTAIIGLDLDGKVHTVWNKAAEKMLGWKADEVMGKFLPSVPNDKTEEFYKFREWVRSGKELNGIDVVRQRSDGSRIDYSIYASPIYDSDKKITGNIAVLVDISERIKAQDELKKSEIRFKELFNKSAIPLCLINKSSAKLEFNEKFKSTFGYTKDEIPTIKEWWLLAYPDPTYRKEAMQICDDIINKAIEEKSDLEPTEYHITCKDGQVCDMILLGSSIGNDWLLTFYDVSESKKAKEDLLKNQKRYEKAQEIGKVGNWEYDHVTKCFWGSDEAKKIYGFDLESNEFTTDKVESCIPERERVHQALIDLIEHDKEYDLEFDIVTFNNRIRKTIHSIAEAERDSNGNLLRVSGVISDITEQKDVEKSLRESESRFSTIFLRNPMPIVLTRLLNNQITEVNKAWLELTGYSKNEVIGKTPYELDLYVDYNKREQLVSNLKIHKNVDRLEFQIRKKNGTIIDLLFSAEFIELQGEPYMVSMAVDVTEAKLLREAELRAERLETAGTIAGQVAHDFNNLLAPIVAYPQLIKEDLSEEHSILSLLDQIESAGVKIADINQQLLTLGRRVHYNQKPVNLNSIVLQVVNSFGQYDENVECITELDPDLLNIIGGEAQLHRVISNLFCNALEAIQENGIIKIKTENYYIDNESTILKKIPKGEYVKLTISDNGCGISEQNIHKILDPFFSTKNTNQKSGSGLGLSVVDAVIKDHHGYLDIHSKIGEDTSFYIYFPPTIQTVEDDKSTDFYRGTETILIVDDDGVQRDVSTNLLKSLGYNVTSVESGEKALKLLKNKKFDLLILDMVMPEGIDGTETYQEVLKIYPEQKALIVSGYSDSEKVKLAQELGAGKFIKKPLTKQTISKSVREELDRTEEISTI